MNSEIGKTITAQELANALRISVSTVYRLTKAGHLPHFQLGGKHHSLRFPDSVLDECRTVGTSTELKADKPIPGPMPKWLTEESADG